MDVFDAQQQPPAKFARAIVIEQRRIGMAQMQVSVRTRCETQDAAVHRRQSIALDVHSTMLTHIRTEADLDEGLAALGKAEPRFTALVAEAGRPPLRRAPGVFAGLAATVVSQQLSTASAGAIWGRLAAAFDPVEPEAIIKARPAKLARIGLSRPKIKA